MGKRETIRYSSVQDLVLNAHGGPEHFPAHWHDAAEFILALKDGCIYRVQDSEYRLSRGDLLLIWPRELHETVHAPEDSSFFIQFSDRLLKNHTDLTVSMRLLGSVRLLSHSALPEWTGQFSSLMKELEAAYETWDPFRETRCKVLIYRILLLTGEYAYRKKIRQLEQDRFSPNAWERIQEACAYIEAHSAEKLSQQEVAGAVNLSTCYFSRLFGKTMQMSFPRYLTQVRVRAAAGMLGKTDLSVTECAYRAGFQSSSAFNSCFREVMGLSPRDYRKRYRNIQTEAEKLP